MYALGITFLVVGGLTFASGIVYYLIDHRRTNVLFRAHKRVLFPVMIGGWLLAMTGMILVAIANGELDGGISDIKPKPFAAPTPLFMVFFVFVAIVMVVSWVRSWRRRNPRDKV